MYRGVTYASGKRRRRPVQYSPPTPASGVLAHAGQVVEGPKDRVCARSYLSPLRGYFVGPPPADPLLGLVPCRADKLPPLPGRAIAARGEGIGGSGYIPAHSVRSHRPLPASKNKNAAMQALLALTMFLCTLEGPGIFQRPAANKDLCGADKLLDLVDEPPLAANRDLRKGQWGKFGDFYKAPEHACSPGAPEFCLNHPHGGGPACMATTLVDFVEANNFKKPRRTPTARTM